jgi:hypothetical protein
MRPCSLHCYTEAPFGSTGEPCPMQHIPPGKSLEQPHPSAARGDRALFRFHYLGGRGHLPITSCSHRTRPDPEMGRRHPAENRGSGRAPSRRGASTPSKNLPRAQLPPRDSGPGKTPGSRWERRLPSDGWQSTTCNMAIPVVSSEGWHWQVAT